MEMDQATTLRKLVSIESAKKRKLGTERCQGFSEEQRRPKVFAVTSGKGGVGKTNVTGNLAIACQRMGKRVLIFDADLGLANVDILFGLHPKYQIGEVIKGEKELSEIIVEGPEGVSMIPACSGIQELAHLTGGQKMNLLNDFENLSNQFDILLIDTGAGISDNVLFFSLAAEERIVVVTPEPTSITDAYALIKVLYIQHKTKTFILLSNMVRDEKEGRLIYENLNRVITRFMQDASVDYGGYIPWDPLLPKAVSRREPVIRAFPEGTSSQSFKTLAHFLIHQAEARPMDGNIQFFWKRMMHISLDQPHETRN